MRASLVACRRVATRRTSRAWGCRGRARLLEPRVVGRGVVHHEVGDHAHAALVRRLDERAEVVDRPVVGVDGVEVGDVVAAVAQRRRVERQQPEAVDAEPLEVVELLGQPAEVAASRRRCRRRSRAGGSRRRPRVLNHSGSRSNQWPGARGRFGLAVAHRRRRTAARPCDPQQCAWRGRLEAHVVARRCASRSARREQVVRPGRRRAARGRRARRRGPPARWWGSRFTTLMTVLSRVRLA